jgi:glycosyltransferase involved in cell wall biosynthesis
MSEKIPNGPLVSIILPTYNRAYVIDKAIISILNQTYKNFELIVVDDCSTDNTRDIIEKYLRADNRVRYIRNDKNLGPAGARNIGIESAIGEFIAFQDDDDEWFPYKLEKQVDLLCSLPETFAIVYSGFYKIVGREKNYIPSRSIHPREGNIHDSLLKGNFVDTPSVLVRKSALLNVGFFDENLPILEDWELAIRLSKRYQFKLIDEPLFISHDTPNSVNKQSGAKFAGTLEYIIEKYIDDFSKNKEALGDTYFSCGKAYIMDGKRDVGLRCLFSAIKSMPLNLKYLITLLVSLFGTSVFNKLLYIKRKYIGPTRKR